MIPTAEEWFSDKFQLEIYSRKLTQEEKGIEFAKLHVTEALKQASRNINLIQSSSEEINKNNISPFITADDNTVWIIDKTSILNTYSLEDIK